MTIDEAIAHAREVAERNRKQYKNCPADRRDIEHQTCEECAEEHEQLAEWLEELKAYRTLDKTNFSDGYNKAIDDFAEKAIKVVYEANNRDRNPKPRDMVADIHYKLLEIAELLKVGRENGE